MLSARRTLMLAAAFAVAASACSGGEETPTPITGPTLTTVPPIGTGSVPTSPPPTTVTPSTINPGTAPPLDEPKPGVERFIPTLPLADGVLSLDVEFVDGSTAQVRWPATLDLVSGGLIPYGWAFIAGGSSRDFFVRPGSVEDVMTRLGGAELLGEYPNGEGSMVGFWRPANDDVDYLGFEFDGWTVLVYDYRNDLQMSDEHRALWATSFRGSRTEAGFLLLDAVHPLQLVYAGDYPSPLRMTLRGEDGQVALTPGACEPGVIDPIDSNAFASWCPESADMTVQAYGTRDFQQAALDGFEVLSVEIEEPPPPPEEEEE